MITFNTKWLATIIMTLSLPLIGCGGGGGGSDDSSPTATQSTPNTTETTTEEDQNTGSGESEIAPEFNLTSIQEVLVSIDISAQTTDKTYLSVCHLKETDTNVAEIDYENCVIRSVVEDGTFSGSFKSAPHFEELAVAIWFYDTAQDPIESLISRADMDTGEVLIN